MAYNESAYKNLLFGVSQQAPQDRLPGQLEEQVNMTSDLVAGLRRRASVEALQFVGTYTDIEKVKQYNTDIASTAVSLVVDAANGSVRVVEENTGNVLGTVQSDYLRASSAKALRLVTLNDAVWLCNVEQKPTIVDSPDKVAYPNPDQWGYFYIVAGAFSKEYRVTLTDRVTGSSVDVAYTTPAGTVSGDVEKATPEYIATQLVTAANTAWATYGATLYREGGYVAIKTNAATKPTISTVSGSAYIRASNAMSIRDVAELPARLHKDADNLIVATGSGNIKTYYRYDDARKVWTEDASWTDIKAVANMPLRLIREVGGAYVLSAPTYERRAAGDAKSNPFMKFLTDGITGMAAFQGRLVFLSNEYCCMSASDNPLRFFRSTIATIADNDPIEIAAQGSLTAPYEYAVNFNKDLVMFSRRYQGVVPGSSLVTPRTANIALMTRYEVDTSAEPTAAGRSIFFGAPRSLGFVGMHEMVPSQYSDSQYVADDVTSHIPRYIKGPWRFIIASTTSNILVAAAQDRRELVIHEYLWSAAEKVHHAWHKWVFQYPVIDAYFSGDVLVALFGVNGNLLIARLDLQRGAGDLSPTVPRLDFYQDLVCVDDGVIRAPAFLTALTDDLRAFKVRGANSYLGQVVREVVPVDEDFVDLVVPEAVQGDVYAVGATYTSRIIPTSPVIKDSKDVPITTSRAVLHRYRVSVANTGQFTYHVYDKARSNGDPVQTTPLRLYSQRLGAGMPLADTATVTVPARVDMWTAMLELATDDYYDLNVRSIEYGFRFHQRFRRA